MQGAFETLRLGLLSGANGHAQCSEVPCGAGNELPCLALSTCSLMLCCAGLSNVHLGPALLVALEARLPVQAPATCYLRDATVQIAAQPAVFAPPMLQCVPQGTAPGANSARLGCLSFGT